MDHFSARDRDGDLVVLRLPDRLDMACLQRRENEVRAGARGAGAQLLEGAGEELEAFPAPVWMLRSRGCCDGECLCQLLDLSVALEVLPPEQLSRAVNAHLAVMGHLGVHISAVSAVLAGCSTLGQVCVRCLTDPAPHLEVLDQEVLERARELSTAVALHRLEVTVSPRSGPLEG